MMIIGIIVAVVVAWVVIEIIKGVLDMGDRTAHGIGKLIGSLIEACRDN